MRSVILGVLAAVFLVAGCSSGGSGSEDEDKAVAADTGSRIAPFGQQRTATSDSSGIATLAFDGASVPIEVIARDGGESLPGIEVHGAALSQGIFVWSEDGGADYLPGSGFISYDKVARRSHPQMKPKVAPAVVLVLALARAASVASTIHEFVTDPPGIEEVFADNGITTKCAHYDINDASSLLGVYEGVGIVKGFVRVVGKALDSGVTVARNYGFLAALNNYEAKEQFFSFILEKFNPELDKERYSFCLVYADDRVLPIKLLKVDGVAVSGLSITDINFPDQVEIAPSKAERTEQLEVSWSGTPLFPVTLELTAIKCPPSWVCPSESVAIQENDSNPYSLPWGCWSVDGDTDISSAEFIYAAHLVAADSSQSPPAAFAYQCVSPGTLSVPDGKCGDAVNRTYCSRPVSQLCAAQTPASVSYNPLLLRWEWHCGSTSCSAPKRCGVTESQP